MLERLVESSANYGDLEKIVDEPSKVITQLKKLAGGVLSPFIRQGPRGQGWCTTIRDGRDGPARKEAR